jgi:hypothetical protein
LEVVEVEVGQYLGRQPGAQGGGGVFGPPKDVAKETIVGVCVEARGVRAWRRIGWVTGRTRRAAWIGTWFGGREPSLVGLGGG